jgi:hypothetical protein
MPAVMIAAGIGAGASLLGGSMQAKAAKRCGTKHLQKHNLRRHELRLKRLSFALLV